MDLCLPLYVMFFIFFIFEFYLMILKCQIANKKSTLFYLQNSLTYTTIMNFVILGIIILMNNTNKFKNAFGFVVGMIGMLCSSFSILISIYYMYFLCRGIFYINQIVFWDYITMNMKCFVLAYETFSNSYSVYIPV